MGEIEQGDVVRAELVARVGAKGRDHGMYLGGSAERIGVGALAGDPDDTVLYQRTGEEAQVWRGLDPAVCRVMKHMLRIEQREQCVDVEEAASTNRPAPGSAQPKGGPMQTPGTAPASFPLAAKSWLATRCTPSPPCPPKPQWSPPLAPEKVQP